MIDAEHSLAAKMPDRLGREVAGGITWRPRVVVIILMLGAIGFVQTMVISTAHFYLFMYLAYFIPIAAAARYFSRRGAIEVAITSSAIYVLAFAPAFNSLSESRTELTTEVAVHVCLFLAAGFGFSEIKRAVTREKERALDAERERTNKLQLMLDVSSTVSSSLKIEQVLQVLAVRIAEATGATFCRISLLDEARENLRVIAAYPERDMDWEPSIGRDLPIAELPDHRRAIESGEPVLVGGRRPASEKTLSESRRHAMAGVASMLLYPLVVDGEAVGVVCIGGQHDWERSPISSEKTAICQTIVNQGAKAVAHALTHEALEDAFLGTIRSLADAIDAKDPSTRGHSDWVSKYAVMISRQLEMEDEEVEMIKYSGYLHDVGKIGISDKILGKPSQLTPGQWQLMKKHTILGAKIMEPVHISPVIKNAVRHHHERYDGKGYPYGLSGSAIPIEARILAVADAYEAMTADRPYRRALSDEQAVTELNRCSGSQFDPRVVQALLGAMGRVTAGPVEAGIETATG